MDKLTLRGQYIVTRPATAPTPQLRLGGLSGLANLSDGRQLLAVADDADYPRVFRLSVRDSGNSFRVDTTGIIYLESSAAAPSRLDPEAIAVTRDGHLLITSEGSASEQPRLPPAILEYSGDGQFVRQLPVKPRVLAERARADDGRRPRKCRFRIARA